MTIRNYLMLCAALALLTCLAIIVVPGVGDFFETIMLVFLATTAG